MADLEVRERELPRGWRERGSAESRRRQRLERPRAHRQRGETRGEIQEGQTWSAEAEAAETTKDPEERDFEQQSLRDL